MRGRVIRTAAALLFAVLICFFLSDMLRGMISWGNSTGSICSVIGILLCVLYPKYKKKLLYKIVLVMLTVSISYAGTIFLFIITGSENAPVHSDQPRTIVILGHMIKDGEPSLMLKARLDKGLEYLRENPGDKCVVTGGQGRNENEPEGAVMRRYLISAGIDESRIYSEETSVNTRENLANAKRVIEENSLPGKIVIVSESYHIYRSKRIAERLELDAKAAGAFSEKTWTSLPSSWAREVIAVTNDYYISLTGG